jgi:hypothetical protein
MVCVDGWKCNGACAMEKPASIYDWYMRRNGWTFRQASDYLSGETLTFLNTLRKPKIVPFNRVENGTNSIDSNERSMAWRTAADAGQRTAQDYLWSDQPDAHAALDWLHTSRHFTDETIRRYGLGYLPHWTPTTWLKDDGKPAHVAPGVVIPIHDGSGLAALKVRCRVGSLATALGIEPDHLNGQEMDKYLYLSGSRVVPFLAGDFDPERQTVIVESALDAMLIQQVVGGLVNVLATNGAANGVAQYAEQLEAGPGTLAIMDNDQNNAGEAWGVRLAEVVSSVRLEYLPLGKDPTEYVDQGGDLAAWLAETLRQMTLNRIQHAWIDGVPDTARAAFNRYAPELGALVELWLEALRQGLTEPGEMLTIANVLELAKSAGRDLSEPTIRRALRRHGLDFRALCHPIRSIQDKGSGNTENPIGQSARKSTADGPQPDDGRPGKRYALPPASNLIDLLIRLAAVGIFEECFPVDDPTVAPIRAGVLQVALDSTQGEAVDLARVLTGQYGALIDAQPKLGANIRDYKKRLDHLRFSLRDPKSTPLPAGWKYRNSNEYAACLARAIIVDAGGATEYSKGELSGKIGRSPRRVNAVLQRAGVKTIKRTHDQVIKSPRDFDRITGYNPELRAYPKKVIASKLGRNTEHVFDLSDRAAVREFVVGQQTDGATVIVRWQQTNRQVIETDQQPEPKARNLSKPELSEHPTRVDEPNQSVNEKRPQPDNIVRQKKAANPFLPSREWSEAQLCKLLALGTSWQRRDDSLIDRSPDGGEVIPYSPQNVIDLLLGKSPQFLGFSEPIKRQSADSAEQQKAGFSEPNAHVGDSLVDFLIELGGTVAGECA